MTKNNSKTTDQIIDAVLERLSPKAAIWAEQEYAHEIAISDILKEIAGICHAQPMTTALFAAIYDLLRDACLAAGYTADYARTLPYRRLASIGVVSPSKKGKGKKGKGKGKTEPVMLTREAFLADVGAKFDALDCAGMLALAQSFVKFAKQTQK